MPYVPLPQPNEDIPSYSCHCAFVPPRRVPRPVANGDWHGNLHRRAHRSDRYNHQSSGRSTPEQDPQPDIRPVAVVPRNRYQQEHFRQRQSRAAWAEVISEPERFIPAGDRIVVFVHARVRPKDGTEWQEVRLADVYTFRNGKAVNMRAFADRQEALRWVGM